VTVNYLRMRTRKRWTSADVAAAQGRITTQTALPVIVRLPKLVTKPIALPKPSTKKMGGKKTVYRSTWDYRPFGGFEFRLPWAPSVNNAYVNRVSGGRRKSSRAREYATLVMAELLAQRVPCNTIAHPLGIWIIQHASSDQGDCDNGQKIVIDCLKRYGVIADDNRAIVKDVRVTDGARVAPGKEFIEVRISCISPIRRLT
jgi:Holliday junction resolvase RusA-like endonuclease